MLRPNTISRLLGYYFNTPKYDSDLIRSTREFFDKPNFERNQGVSGVGESIGFYNEWFMYDFLLSSNETPLANFVRMNPFSMSKEEIRVYEDLLDNHFDLFEILDVKPTKGMALKSLHDQKEFFVEEFSVSLDAQKGFGIFTRVAKVGDHYEMVGSDLFAVPLSNPVFKPYLEKILKKTNLNPKDIHIMLTTGDMK